KRLGSSYYEHSLESHALHGKCRRIRLQGRRDPNTPTGGGPARERGERGQQKSELSNTEAGDEDLDQALARPTLTRQTSIERGVTRGKCLRPRGTAAAPDGRMLEQA